MRENATNPGALWIRNNFIHDLHLKQGTQFYPLKIVDGNTRANAWKDQYLVKDFQNYLRNLEKVYSDEQNKKLSNPEYNDIFTQASQVHHQKLMRFAPENIKQMVEELFHKVAMQDILKEHLQNDSY